MSVARNIAATYRGPKRVIARLLSDGPREDRALAYVMAACALMFIAQLPRLARESHLTGEDLNMLMGGALLGTVFIAPLLLYGLAWLSHLVAKVFGGQGSFWSARMALFWALLASAPLLLLHGLVAGFIGPGPQLTIVGLAWCAAFFCFWGTGLWCAEKGVPA
jgi:hypothetical protein